MISEDPWMYTKSGRRFHFLNPDPDEIDIGDISWALANKTRFNGHTERAYTVAQHCCLVLDRHQEISTGYDSCMWALLHDATEAYLPDVHTHLKDHLGGFRDLEKSVENAIAKRFRMRDKPSESIKYVDRRMMATEVRDLTLWEPFEGIIDVEPYEEKIVVWEPIKSEYEFNRRFTRCRGLLND